MKNRQTENEPERVPEEAKQSGEALENKERVEPEVWTERMLTALENGVKGGKWFSLIDKVYTVTTLRKAYHDVKAKKGGAGVDNQTIEMFEKSLEDNLKRISEEIQTGIYKPRAIKRVYIDKPGSKEKRPLGIPTVRDRVIQGAVKKVIEPIFEKDFSDNSYGFRPGMDCKDALRRVDKLLKSGYTWAVDADLKSYFDTIPHDKLMCLIESRIADGRILELIRSFLKQGVWIQLRAGYQKKERPRGQYYPRCYPTYTLIHWTVR